MWIGTLIAIEMATVSDGGGGAVADLDLATGGDGDATGSVIGDGRGDSADSDSATDAESAPADLDSATDGADGGSADSDCATDAEDSATCDAAAVCATANDHVGRSRGADYQVLDRAHRCDCEALP